MQQTRNPSKLRGCKRERFWIETTATKAIEHPVERRYPATRNSSIGLGWKWSCWRRSIICPGLILVDFATSLHSNPCLSIWCNCREDWLPALLTNNEVARHIYQTLRQCWRKPIWCCDDLRTGLNSSWKKFESTGEKLLTRSTGFRGSSIFKNVSCFDWASFVSPRIKIFINWRGNCR